MNCTEAAELFSSYLDGELEEGERLALEAHLASCAGCEAEVRTLRSLKHAVGRLGGRAEPPESVRARVHALSLRKSSRARRIPVSVLFVAACAALALFLARATHRDRPPAQLLAELISDHAKYVPRGMPAEIASEDPAQIRSFFEGRVRFSPAVPRLPGARLIGGRLCRLGGEPVQLLFYLYQRQGLPLSLYVTALDLPAGKCHARGKLRACVEKKAPLAFILVGEVPESELRELLRGAGTDDGLWQGRTRPDPLDAPKYADATKPVGPSRRRSRSARRPLQARPSASLDPPWVCIPATVRRMERTRPSRGDA